MIADVVVVGIMALCIFFGYARGLIGVAVKILGFIAALLIALIFYTPVSNYIINNTEIVSEIQKTIEDKIYIKDNESEEVSSISNENLSQTVEQYIDEYTDEMKSQGAEYVANGLAIAVVRVRNMDRIICYCKNINDIYKNICKYNRKNTNNKTI